MYKKQIRISQNVIRQKYSIIKHIFIYFLHLALSYDGIAVMITLL